MEREKAEEVCYNDFLGMGMLMTDAEIDITFCLGMGVMLQWESLGGL